MIINYITNTRKGLKVGERNQALGVVDALRAVHKDAIMLEYDIGDIARLAEVLTKYDKEKHIVIGVSDSGVQAFSHLPVIKNSTAILMGHEVPEHAETVADKIHILAVPGHVTHCPDMKGVIIVRTDGVSNTMTAEKAAYACRDWMHKFAVGRGQPVVVAMLGGTVDGKDYQPHEAERMAEYIAEKAREKGAYIIATNSPRSNPHDTEVFTRTLSSSGCDNAFFPFDMKNQNNETPYRAMVGLVAKSPENRIVMTGDSVSMPCEIARVVPPRQMYLYPVSNINRQNQEFMEWMYRNGRAGRVNTAGFTEEYVPSLQVLDTMDAAGQIAQAMLSIM